MDGNVGLLLLMYSDVCEDDVANLYVLLDGAKLILCI
jgi:hypothetical protein